MSVQLLSVSDYHESPSHDDEVASGRAVCRFCGLKIAKGEHSIMFYPAPGGGCRWEAIIAHVHRSCAVERNCQVPKIRKE